MPGLGQQHTVWAVADPEGVVGWLEPPFVTKLFLFYGDFSEKSGKNNK